MTRSGRRRRSFGWRGTMRRRWRKRRRGRRCSHGWKNPECTRRLRPRRRRRKLRCRMWTVRMSGRRSEGRCPPHMCGSTGVPRHRALGIGPL
ncbi:hypothetical protein T484DRAFT_1903718 [Baffinella frigidus]|nr:hypothetical protein T484DRAFT_1903718 [Cryptophyta sp. CCMP2293]